MHPTNSAALVTTGGSKATLTTVSGGKLTATLAGGMIVGPSPRFLARPG